MNPLLLTVWQIADYLEQEPLPKPSIPKDLQIDISIPKSNIPPKLPQKPQPKSSNPPSTIIYDDNSRNENHKKMDTSIYSSKDNIPITPTLNERSPIMSTPSQIILDLTTNNDKSEDDVDMLRPSRKNRKSSPTRTTNSRSRSRSKKPTKKTNPETEKRKRNRK